MPDKTRNTIVDLTAQIGWIEGNDYHKFPGWQNVTDAMREAVALLKEQEPMKVEWHIGRAHCPSCGELFPRKKETKHIRFCSFCGQAVKWDEI